MPCFSSLRAVGEAILLFLYSLTNSLLRLAKASLAMTHNFYLSITCYTLPIFCFYTLFPKRCGNFFSKLQKKRKFAEIIKSENE